MRKATAMPKDNPESIAKAEASARRALVRAEAAAARQKDEEEMQAFLRACPTLDDIDVNALDQHEVTVFEKILASQHYEEKLLKLNKTRERVHAAAKRRLQTTLERVRCMEAAVSGLVGVTEKYSCVDGKDYLDQGDSGTLGRP